MKVKVAKTAGFCMGVRRAMDCVLAEARQRQPDEVIHTYGPLIHNNQVLEMLEARGVRCLDSLDKAKSGRVIIRAHGIPPQERRAIKNSGLKIINATCPKVARVQGVVKKYALQGYHVVIVGDENHAEVVGLKGFASGRALVLNRPEEVEFLPEMDKILVVAQTTQDERVFQETASRLQERFAQALIHNTICDSTHNRQEEVRQLCREADAMVVVGGHHSANTRRLAEVAAATGIPTFHVETEEELDRERLCDFKMVAVTAGASTPNWLIKRMVHELESIEPGTANPAVRLLRQGMRFLLQSNLYVAGGAACLTYAAAVLQGLRPRALEAAVASLYIFAMHVLNRYADKAARFNDPSRAAFYERYKIPFSVAGTVAGVIALVLAACQGKGTLLALISMTFLGLLYSVRIIPEGWLKVIRVGKLKDIPASKTIFIAGAWGAVAALLPALRSGWQVGWSTIAALTVIFFLVFVRSALFDLLDVHGDRLVGKETIPVVLGEKGTRVLLVWQALLAALVLALAPSLGLSTGFGYLMLINCAYAGVYLYVYRRDYLRPDSLGFEALVESNFYLAGALAILYQLIAHSG